jgi:hypothetical protein
MFLILPLFQISIQVSAQDEGEILKKERISNSRSFWFSGGPSFRFGNNKSDYSRGFTLEAGFLKQFNRILSIGPALSFSKFNYDESISDSFGDTEADGNNIFYDDDPDGDPYLVKVVYLEGGDLTFFSLGCNMKVNFISREGDKGFSVYGIAKPFLLICARSEVSATVEPWWRGSVSPPDDPSDWTYGGPPDEFLSSETPGLERWASDTEFSGGINLGLGGEYILSSGVSFFVNSIIGLTLPVTHINTGEFINTTSKGYYHPDYPFVKKGFTSLNILVGGAYRF